MSVAIQDEVLLAARMSPEELKLEEVRPMFDLADLPEDLREVGVREIGKINPEKVAKHLGGLQP